MREVTSMTGVETVFVATDLSAAADEALRQGHERAQAGARLVVCHVIPRFSPIRGLSPAFDEPAPVQFAEFRYRISEEVVRRTVAVTGRTTADFDVLLEEGDAYASIVARAEELRADVLVVGSHGATGLARALLGSVADKVIRYAHCPVLIARPRTQTRRILVATDLSVPSFPAVAAAVHEARRTDAALTVLHCMETATSIHGFEWGGMWPREKEHDEKHEQLRRKADSSLADVLARYEMTGERRVVAGSPAAAIVSACDEIRPDLLVVGTRGRTGLRRVMLGSVAESVSRLAPCSVLIVRLGSRALDVTATSTERLLDPASRDNRTP